MPNILELSGDRVANRYLHDSGGAGFAGFVTLLIRTHLAAHGVPDSAIHTDCRTQTPDGGADAQVDLGVADEPTGWLRSPTIWQFKARNAATALQPKTLEEEVSKPYAMQCIAEGMAYRYCIAGTVTPESRDKANSTLAEAVKRINPDAPPPLILSADDLAALANRYPAFVMRCILSEGREVAQTLADWRPMGNTSIYVPGPQWDTVFDAIRRHCDFAVRATDAVLPITGQAGSGKTRLVYEALRRISGAEGLVLYTCGNDVGRVLNLLCSQADACAILVADEVDLGGFSQLREKLAPIRDRVRAIVIMNTFLSDDSTAVYEVSRPNEMLETILEANYPHVPWDRRRAYAGLAEGHVRFAADLCAHDSEIQPGIAVSEAATQIGLDVEGYVCARLSDKLRSVAALSLVSRLGCSGEPSQECEDLCAWLNLDHREVERDLKRVSDEVGFVERTGRYYSVVPELVARCLFAKAWHEWLESDPRAILRNLPPSLLEPFLQRVSSSATEEVRQVVGDVFRDRVSELGSAGLNDLNTIRLLEKLVEVQPDEYLPTLRRLVAEATPDQLPRPATWIGDSPRRRIVGLCERLAALPNCFEAVEEILLKLACNETEPGIANNATGVYARLFSITASNTSVPFEARIAALRERLVGGTPEERRVAVRAAGSALTPVTIRLLGPKVVAGRIPASEWRPGTLDEYAECLRAVCAVLRDAACGSDSETGAQARSVIIENLRHLLWWGLVEDVRRALDTPSLSDRERCLALERIDEFVAFDCREDRPANQKPHVDAVKADANELRAVLAPSGGHGRIVELVGVSPWHHAMVPSDERWRAALADVARDLFEDCGLLRREVKWLCGPDALSARVLGYSLGQIDGQAKLLHFLVDSAMGLPNHALCCGYVAAIADAHGETLRSELDRIADKAPELAHELGCVAPLQTDALVRAVQLVEEGRLAPVHLAAFQDPDLMSKISVAQFAMLLGVLIAAAKDEQSDTAVKIALQLAYDRCSGISLSSLVEIGPEVADGVWTVLQLSAGTSDPLDTYYWSVVLTTMASLDLPRAAGLAFEAIALGAATVPDGPQDVLRELASRDSVAVTHEFCKALFNDEWQWRLTYRSLRELVPLLSEEELRAWLETVGVEAARRLAPHLPMPTIDEDGTPDVPSITQYVLDRFEDDEDVFEAFVFAGHAFQVYSGDIVSQKRKESDLARKFRDHPLRRIRQWAKYEVAETSKQAAWWQNWTEEADFHD